MIIDVSKPDTIPAEVTDIFEKFVDNLSENAISKIINYDKSIEYSTHVACAIEDYMAPFVSGSEELYEDILSCFDKHSLRCYHATRILDNEEILKNGLHTNDWERYSAFMRHTLKAAGVEVITITEALALIEKEYHRKYDLRNKQLCYFVSMNSFKPENGGAGYDQFCQNVGGELARWALKNKMPEIYQVLKKIGFPAIIEFELPFTNIASHDRSSTVYHFLKYFSGKRFWKKEFAIEFDGMTDKDVSSSQIISIQHNDKEIPDYE